MTVHPNWAAHPGLGRAHGAVAVLAAYQGLTLLLGDPARSSAAAFNTIREVGGTTAWGLLLLGGAAALVAAACVGPRSTRAALLVGAMVHGLLALWFALAALHNPAVSLWGPGQFTIFCFWHVSQAMEYEW